MLKRILAEKLDLIQHPKDIYFKEALRSIFACGHSGAWKDGCRELFTKILSRIAIEENVSPFDEEENEILFKHHLPDFVTGLIKALEEILYLPDDSSAFNRRAPDEFETALHLLLRLLEWTVWNYEGGRCIYGRENAQRAESVFKLAHHKLEVWGDRDEVWLTLMDILKEEFHLEQQIETSETYYSCRTYSMIIRNLPGEVALAGEYWCSPTPPSAPIMIVSIQSKIIDQSTVKLELKDLKDQSQKSTGILEANILGRVANICGTPFYETLTH